MNCKDCDLEIKPYKQYPRINPWICEFCHISALGGEEQVKVERQCESTVDKEEFSTD